ncbi:MAG: pitrilysin family protein [Patescibacteria group bacterium]|nr:pitrilysin family protein [Patescibacteria group bacterium]
MTKYQLTTREDGLAVITIPMPSSETITATLMFRAGARYENPKKWGLAHFFEHMIFKGTKNYPTSKALSEVIDAIGGIQNAYTCNETITLWIKGDKTATDKIFEVISEKATLPTFPIKEVPKERRVVVEELRMYKDQPDAWLSVEWMNALMNAQKPTMHALGCEKSVNEFTRSDLLEHFKLFSPHNAVSVVAGNITHDAHLKLAKRYYKFANKAKAKAKESVNVEKLSKNKVLFLNRKEITQANIIIGTSLPGLDNKDWPAMRMLDSVLDGGMSSRLFQELREKHNLCYTVHSGAFYASDFGIWSVDGGMNIANVEKASKLILQEIEKLRDKLVPAAELQRAKGNSRGHIAIASESTGFVSDLFARHFLLTGKVKTIDSYLEENEAVTPADIRRVAQKYLAPERLRLGVIGPFEKEIKDKLEKLF